MRGIHPARPEEPVGRLEGFEWVKVLWIVIYALESFETATMSLPQDERNLATFNFNLCLIHGIGINYFYLS
jgi:hypothetical protein